MDPRAIKGAGVLGPVKAKPWRVAAKARPALTAPARTGCDNRGRDGRMLAARVEQKNGPTLLQRLTRPPCPDQHKNVSRA
jgi:hypothetical protein